MTREPSPVELYVRCDRDLAQVRHICRGSGGCPRNLTSGRNEWPQDAVTAPSVSSAARWVSWSRRDATYQIMSSAVPTHDWRICSLCSFRRSGAPGRHNNRSPAAPQPGVCHRRHWSALPLRIPLMISDLPVFGGGWPSDGARRGRGVAGGGLPRPRRAQGRPPRLRGVTAAGERERNGRSSSPPPSAHRLEVS